MATMDDSAFSALTNTQCFDRGANFDATVSRASIGILSPRPTTVHAGQVLYKFGSLGAQTRTANGSYTPGHGTLYSPWWFDVEAFKIIWGRHLKSKSELGLGFAGRSAAAIPFKWQGAKYPSTMDYLVKAQVSTTLFALTGRGSRQEAVSNGITFSFSGWKEIRQLFIPGLNDATIRMLSSSPINSYNPDPSLL